MHIVSKKIARLEKESETCYNAAMEKEKSLAKKRFLELSERAAATKTFTFTGFLNADEQAALFSMKRELALPFSLFGGAADCERQIARFGLEEEFGCAEPFPISCVEIVAAATRFGAELSHRDVLGAVLGLGIDRAVLGDIAIRSERAFVFCLSSIAEWIGGNLSRVGRQDVKCSVSANPPNGPLYALAEQRIQISSERADAVVAKAYSLSREESAGLFMKERIFVDSAPCGNGSRQLKEGEIVSVRGFGRFVYSGVIGTSKKGRLNAVISKYC